MTRLFLAYSVGFHLFFACFRKVSDASDKDIINLKVTIDEKFILKPDNHKKEELLSN